MGIVEEGLEHGTGAYLGDCRVGWDGGVARRGCFGVLGNIFPRGIGTTWDTISRSDEEERVRRVHGGRGRVGLDGGALGGRDCFRMSSSEEDEAATGKKTTVSGIKIAQK